MEFSNNCTLYIYSNRSEPLSLQEILKKLESSDEELKIEGLQELIVGMVNAERMDRALMHVIRFALPCSSKRIKRLAYLFLEIVDKCTPTGELREEMILVCNALRNDLTCPNEYIRGCALRLVATIKQWKIIEPLLEAVLKNLAHRHSYVRRNAVMCVYALYKTFGGEALPGTSEAVDKLLLLEGDASTRRGAFLMLLHTDVDRAVMYVQQQLHLESTEIALPAALSMGDLFLLALLKLFTIVCRNKHPIEEDMFSLILALLPSAPPAVAYQGACAILSVSKSVEAVRAACAVFVSLLRISTDTNIILVLLDRIKECIYAPKYITVLCEFVVDILRGLHTSCMEVRKSSLDLCLCLCCPDTVSRIIQTFKQEIAAFSDTNDTMCSSNKRMLVDAVYACCIRYPKSSESVLNLFGDLLGDSDGPCALKSALFFRTLAVLEPEMRPKITQKIMESIEDIQHTRALRVCLWIIGEYCENSAETICDFFDMTYQSLQPFPLSSGNDKEANQPAEKTEKRVQTRTVILDDGTYGTQDITSTDNEPQNKVSFLRKSITKKSDTLLGTVLCVTITKLFLRSNPIFVKAHQEKLKDPNMKVIDIAMNQKNRMLLLVASVLRFIRSQTGLQSDASIRINQCLRCICSVLKGAENSTDLVLWFLTSPAKVCRVASAGDYDFSVPKRIQQKRQVAPATEIEFRHLVDSSDTLSNRSEVAIQPFEPDQIYLSTMTKQTSRNEIEDQSDIDPEETDIAVALGDTYSKNDRELFLERLQHIHPLTSLTDPIYAEVFLRVVQFDVVAEILLVNRTNETLYNVHLELCSHGDMRIVDRPSSLTLEPGQYQYVYNTIKVRSTETGIIYGYVLYNTKGSTTLEHLILAEISINPLLFIQPTYINNGSFQSKWAEFEWENKLYINSTTTDVGMLLGDLLRHTHMTVVGSEEDDEFSVNPVDNNKFDYSQDSETSLFEMNSPVIQTLKHLQKHSFFSVNLYSKSIFGEDALANVSLEKVSPNRIAGSIRIRSRTQGIALSVGDRITSLQRKMTPAY